MPLPPEALTISGGCNCASIRYRISIPPISSRALHPASTSSDPVHLPFVCVDHCNDCRRATGSLIGVVLCCPTSYAEISFLPKTAASNERSGIIEPSTEESDAKREWMKAEDLFPLGATGDRLMAERLKGETCWTWYQSSEGRWRIFCGNCGTQFAYTAWPYPEGWPLMADFWIGSVDQKDLEKDWLIPERHLWYDVGIEWIRKFASEGSGGVPKHGDYRIDQKAEKWMGRTALKPVFHAEEK